MRKVEARAAATSVVLPAFERAFEVETGVECAEHASNDLISEDDFSELRDAVARHFDLLGVAVLLRQFAVGPLTEMLHVESVHLERDVTILFRDGELLFQSLQFGHVLSAEHREVRKFTDASQDAIL